VNAIAGAGKTYRIVNEFTVEDVVICAVRSTADDTLAAILSLKKPDGTFKFAGLEKVVARRVRSNDSATMHAIPRAKVLFADEGLMTHSGQLVIVANTCRAKVVKVFGDETQLRLIQRGSKLVALRLESLLFWTQMVEMNETVRLPADALLIHASFHSPRRAPLLRTFSPIMRSIKWHKVVNDQAREFKFARKGVCYMSILRTDKGVLVGNDGFYDGKKPQDAAKGVSPVFTGHEAQGKSEPHWVLVRINAKTVGVLNSKPHQNVVFTRHWVTLDVVTTKGPVEDPLAALAVRAMEFTEEELRAVQLPAPDWLIARIEQQNKKEIGKW